LFALAYTARAFSDREWLERIAQRAPPWTIIRSGGAYRGEYRGEYRVLTACLFGWKDRFRGEARVDRACPFVPPERLWERIARREISEFFLRGRRDIGEARA